MPLMTRQEIAAELKVTPRTIQNLEKRGLPFSKVGDSPRYDLAAVQAWIADPVLALAVGYMSLVPKQRTEVREIIDEIERQEKG